MRNRFSSTDSDPSPDLSKDNLTILQRMALWCSTHSVRLAGHRLLDIPTPKKAPKLPGPERNRKYLLYMHIPFCRTLCSFCSFHRFKFDEKTARRYFSLLRQELKQTKALGYDFKSVYVGGGTTTILPDELAKTLDLARELFSIEEVSVESDPNVDEDLLEHLEGRVDRISVGLQSTKSTTLNKMERLEKFGLPEAQIAQIRNLVGHFPVVNVDLIFGMPGQTQEDISEDIRLVQQLEVEQITTYPLMRSTNKEASLKKLFGSVEQDETGHLISLYSAVLDSMNGNYSMATSWAYTRSSTYSAIDEYVTDYDEYVGLGSGAFSFIQGALYVSTFSLPEYEQRVLKNGTATERSRQFPRPLERLYRIMVEGFSGGLRRYTGLVDRSSAFLLRLVGAFDSQNRTTRFGKFMFLMMMREFYTGMDRVRDQARSGLTEEDERLDGDVKPTAPSEKEAA